MRDFDASRVAEITRKGDFYEIRGRSGSGKDVKLDIPITTLEGMSRKDAEGLMKRSIHGVAAQDFP